MKRRTVPVPHAARFARSTGLLAMLASLSMPWNLAWAQEREAAPLEEVIVTARYREASVQDLGLSIRAFGEDEMNRLGITDISGLARFTPSLNIQERGPNRNEMNIRGVSNFLITQDLVPSSRPVGIYIDQTPVNTLGGSQFDLRLFDMERVEVLRGPQGTLYGEGSSAGAVRYFTRDPSLSEFEGHVEAEGVTAGDGGSDFNARAAVSLPIIEDRLALRLVAGTFNYPGFIDVVGGDDDVNELDATMFRAVLLAQLTDDLRIRAMLHYDDSEQGSLGLYTADPGDRVANLPLNDARVDDETLVGNLQIDWQVASGTVTSLTSYFDRARDRYSYDQIFSLVNSITTIQVLGLLDQTFLEDHITQEQWSQELRYVSQFDGPFQFTVGAFYKDFTFESPAGDTCTDTNLVFGLPDRCTGVSLDMLGFDNPDVGLTNEGEQLSVYAEGEFSFAERFRLIAGLRWHNEDLQVSAPEITGFLGFSPIVYPAIGEEVSIDVVLPKVALEFAASESMLLYGQYSTGARNGNLNSPATLASMELFVPGSSAGFESYGDDSTATYEVGIKSQFADGRVTFNAASWYTDYEDLQVTVAVPPLGFAVLLNASEAISTGVEFDLFANPVDNITLFAGASYTSSELDSDLLTNQVTGAITPKGTALPFAPEWTWNGGGEYVWPLQSGLDLYLNGNFSYTGEMTSSLAATSVQVGDFWMFGAGLGVRADNWSLDFLVSNLTDEAEPVAINNFDPFFQQNTGALPPTGFTFNEQFMTPPRTYRLALRYHF